MKHIGAILSFLKMVLGAVGLWLVRDSGKKAAKLEAAEEKLEAINETNSIHDAVESDPEYRDRLHDHFNR